MSKPGRNDPCYCGSGKKYKQCHMNADKEAENEKRLLAEAGRWLRRDFLRFAREERFAEPFAQALVLYWNGLYHAENAEQMSENEAFRFFDWFVFDYQPVDQPRLIELYHTEKRPGLSEPQQQVLDTWLSAPPAAAYELLDYEGQRLQLRDFMSEATFEAYEPAGHGVVEPGDLLLARLVPLPDQLEFSTVAAYLPQDEIADLKEKLEAARTADGAEYPEDTDEAFLRRRGYLIIHHALEQAELKGRPPVAASDPGRSDNLARQAAQRIRKMQRH